MDAIALSDLDGGELAANFGCDANFGYANHAYDRRTPLGAR
jgi:hypothetical protein